MIHLVQPPLAAGRHPPLGRPALLVPQLALRSLVAEDLDLGARGHYCHGHQPHLPGSIPGAWAGCSHLPGGRHTCRSGHAAADPSLLFVY